MQPTVAIRQALPPASVVCERVAKLQLDGAAIKCILSSGGPLMLSRFLASFINPNDQLEFDPGAADPTQELRVLQASGRRPRELYFASIGYVTQPKADKRHDYFLRAEIAAPCLGVKHIHLICEAVRDYFYFSNRRRPGCEEETLFDLLGTGPSASAADLRLVLKLRVLELQTEVAYRGRLLAVERAFNVLARPEL